MTYFISKIIAGIAMAGLYVLYLLLRRQERRDEEDHESDWV